MKKYTRQRTLLSCGIACLSIMSASTTLAASAGEVYEGWLSQITMKSVTVDGSHTFSFDPKKATCFDWRGDKTTCETLVAVGYADKGRITVVSGVVTRVDIIELQQ
jgi:hypothetical protein